MYKAEVIRSFTQFVATPGGIQIAVRMRPATFAFPSKRARAKWLQHVNRECHSAAVAVR